MSWHLRLSGQVVALSLETVFSSSIFDGYHFPISAGIRVKSAASSIRVHRLTLLQPVVSSITEVDCAVMIQLTVILQDLSVDWFLRQV